MPSYVGNSSTSPLFHHHAAPNCFFPNSYIFLATRCDRQNIFVSSHSRHLRMEPSNSQSDGKSNASSINESYYLDNELTGRLSCAKDADEALATLAEISDNNHRVVGVPACCAIINAATERGNFDLALSIFHSTRLSFNHVMGENELVVNRWKWPKPDVRIYCCLIVGLTVHLKVSDALKTLGYICRAGSSPAEEVPFGKVVKCPSCLIAVAVSQPQHGIQIVSCAKCCYQYELVSGNIISINSEEIRMDLPAWKRGLMFLQVMKELIPSTIHSVVVQTPSGIARTHKFATTTVDLPAQEGERVTIASAAPSTIFRDVGPLKISPKASKYYPGEPMCLTNHRDDRQTLLLRAPSKSEGFSWTNPSVFAPLLAVLATGDAASSFIDPSLPRLLSIVGLAAFGLGATLNTWVLPQLSKLPPRSVEVIAIKQGLLSQYDALQLRIKNLKDATEKEIWMLARMCQLENKIFAVGEPSYSARKARLKKVREGLEKSVKSRIELIDSYAKISSIIEIEVEMDSEVLAAEAVTNVETIAEQIQQVMELEHLEEACTKFVFEKQLPARYIRILQIFIFNFLIARSASIFVYSFGFSFWVQKWRIQAEANDEAERLLSTEIV